MKQNKTIKSAQFEAIGAIICAKMHPTTTEGKIIAYMCLNQMNGLYYSGKGERKKVLKELKLTVDQYRWSVKKMVKQKILVKSIRESNSRYIAYRLPNELIGLNNFEGNFELKFYFPLKKQLVF